MQKKIIENIVGYINCLSVNDNHKIKLTTILHKHQHIEDILKFLFTVHSELEHNYFDNVINMLLSGLSAINILEDKDTSSDTHWKTIKRLENKNPKVLEINALEVSLSIFEAIEDIHMIKRTKIALEVFKSFLDNDALMIENFALTRFHAINYHNSFEQNTDSDELIKIPYDKDKIIDKGSIVRNDLRRNMSQIEPLIETVSDLEYLASFSNYFAGYHLTPEMVLKSIAIKLYNYPLINLSLKKEKINKSALKNSIEELLLPFTEKPKVVLDISKATDFYVKSYFYSVPILALSGKNKMSRYLSYFNPNEYYSELQDDLNNYNLHRISHISLFFQC